MNIQKLRSIVKDLGIFVKETNKNIVVVCCYCGDHKDTRKRGHLYISKDVNIPVVHCFLCGKAVPLNKFIFDLTANKKLAQEVISKDEIVKASKVSRTIVSKKTNVYKIPKLDKDKFQYKTNYIKKRTNFLVNISSFSNLIFDFKAFFKDNNLDDVAKSELGVKGIESLQDTFIGFLSKNHTRIFCRSIDHNAKYSFRKVSLQKSKYDLLDYVSFNCNKSSDLIILSEGTFDILGAYCTNMLNFRNDARLFAAGQSWSYSSLLKSVCFDESLFKCKVVILSDDDKFPGWYRKFIRNSKHIVTHHRLFYNKNKKDFGMFPICPVEVKR